MLLNLPAPQIAAQIVAHAAAVAPAAVEEAAGVVVVAATVVAEAVVATEVTVVDTAAVAEVATNILVAVIPRGRPCSTMRDLPLLCERRMSA
jgi:hypothetical protein